jgi:hypothetical protein
MNSKVWLTVFAVCSVLLLGGSGFYALSQYCKYSETLAGWDEKVGTIQSLERKVPYPNEENSEALAKKLEEYKTAVDGLSTTLQTFNRPLNKELANTEFQQRVKKKVEEFRLAARDGGLAINSTTEFQMGFDSYANTLPSPELVPVLDYELDAIDHLLRELVATGAIELTSFERDMIPGETGGAEKHNSGVVHKYPVRLSFRTSYDSFQKLVNSVTNDKEFFYILRVLKVENQMIEGPIKLTGESGGFQTYQNPVTKEVADPALVAQWSANNATEADIEALAKADGFVLANQDARVLMGQENISVFMVVDITRFLGPDEVTPEVKEVEGKKGSKR